MNIDFKNDEYRFNARASAIIYNEDKTKVLLFKVEDGRDYYLLPGGRIEIFEKSSDAIKREIKEELGFDLNYEICAICENFVRKDNLKNTQYNFCYKAVYYGKITKGKIECKDNNNQSFYWININELNNYRLLPKSSYELIKQENKLKHIIETDTI